MTEQQPQGSQGEGAIDEILRLRAAISAALDAWPEHTRTDEHEAAVGEVLTAVLPEVTKMLSGPDRADTELADLRAEVERLRSAGIDWMRRCEQLTEVARDVVAERDALQRQVGAIPTERAEYICRHGMVGSEGHWCDDMGDRGIPQGQTGYRTRRRSPWGPWVASAVEPADQPHPTPEADER